MDARAARDLVVMGRIVAPYGVRGWVKVQSYAGAPDALLDYASWWIAEARGGAPRPTAVLASRMHGSWVIARLQGVETREAAEQLQGLEVAVSRDALPEVADDEVYVRDLVGLDVRNRRGDALGRIDAVSDAGGQTILRVVADDGVERLIPFVSAIVDEVDLDAGRVVVDWEADY